jgi:hypothetical protein
MHPIPFVKHSFVTFLLYEDYSLHQVESKTGIGNSTIEVMYISYRSKAFRYKDSNFQFDDHTCIMIVFIMS